MPMLWLLRFYGSKLLSLFEKPINSSKTRVCVFPSLPRTVIVRGNTGKRTQVVDVNVAQGEKYFNFINKRQTRSCQHNWQFINPQGFVIGFGTKIIHFLFVFIQKHFFFFFTHSFATHLLKPSVAHFIRGGCGSAVNKSQHCPWSCWYAVDRNRHVIEKRRHWDFFFFFF